MNGVIWQRCTTCSRKINGREARAAHRASDCSGTSGTWAYRVSLGTDADGKRIRRTRAGFSTAADAERAARGLLMKVDANDYVEASDRTLGDFLRREWLPTRRGKDAPTTYAKRERHTRYVEPTLGSRALQDVTAADLERTYATLRAEGGKGGRPLSATTVLDTHRTLHKALSDAVRWGLAARNAASIAEPPSQANADAAARAARQVWTPGEVAAFLRRNGGHRMHAVFTMAAATGARRSELLALTWADLDLDAQRVRFHSAAVKDEAGSYVVRPSTKTSAGARTIALDDATVAVLRTHRATQAAQRLAAGSAWEDSNLVFTDALGAMLSPPSVSVAFKRATEAVDEVPRIRLHDLRHTHATILLQAGVPVRTVSQRLGHASAVVTMSVYSHVLPGDDDRAAAIFEGLLEGRNGTASG